MVRTRTVKCKSNTPKEAAAVLHDEKGCASREAAEVYVVDDRRYFPECRRFFELGMLQQRMDQRNDAKLNYEKAKSVFVEFLSNSIRFRRFCSIFVRECGEG